MQQTLFLIPSSWFDGPLFYAWLIIGLLILGYLYWKHGTGKETVGFLPMYVIIAAVIYFVLPRLQITGLNPEDPSGPMINAGLAIRGWGFCLLLAMFSSVGLVYLRCRQIGFDFDQVLSLVFWMIICGILGARLFYIIQKWDEFAANDINELFAKLADVTKGGVVVYGSLIGGMIAATTFLRFSNLDWRKTLDVIAPAMVLGLAIGRIGCLMNGCCYGGVCDSQMGVQFPAGSPPYVHQLYEGKLIGIQGTHNPETEYPILVESVTTGSLAERRGIQAGDQIDIGYPDSEYFRGIHQGKLKDFVSYISIAKQPTDTDAPPADPIYISISDLPSRSLKVHPTQVYSSVNAFLLCGLLWFYFPFRRFDGEVFSLLIIIYPVARFLLEAIRVDEGGQLNTDLTISQWVSLGLVLAGFSLWAWCRSYPGEPPVDPIPTANA